MKTTLGPREIKGTRQMSSAFVFAAKITFGPDIFAYLKQIGVQIKEKKIVRLQVVFDFLGKIQGRKSQFVNLALYLP